MESFNKQWCKQLILEHYEQPECKLEDNTQIHGYLVHNQQLSNCIDNLTFYLKINNHIVVDAKFSGMGCVISTAAADLLCLTVINKNIIQVQALLRDYEKMLYGQTFAKNKLADLIVFQNIHQHFNRIKCAQMGALCIQNILANLLS